MEGVRVILVAQCHCGKAYVSLARTHVCACGTNILTKPFVALDDVPKFIDQRDFQQAYHDMLESL